MTSSQTVGSNKPLQDQLRALELLQEIDLNILNIRKKRDALPVQVNTLQKSVDDLYKKFETKSNQLTELDKTARQTTAAIEINQERITRTNKKLSGVTNTKEFQAANKEILQLQKLNETLEAQKKKLLADQEAIKKELDEVKAQHEALKNQVGTQIEDLTQQQKLLETDLNKLEGDRGKYLPDVQKATLLQYERIRDKRAGTGIVPAVQGRCQGCNMGLPPQLFNEVQKAQAMCQCPSCHRILFFPRS